MNGTPRLSALVVARNEEAQLAECLAPLAFADEIVVVLDRTTDGSAAIARAHGARLVDGGWELEGPRRNAGIAACGGGWILEVDADERVSDELAREVRATIANAPYGYFLVPFDNYVGDRLVRYGWCGSWGVSAAIRLFAKDADNGPAKVMGTERVHTRLTLKGRQGRLTSRMIHYVDRDISDMLARLDRYTTARAQDLRDSGDIGTLGRNVRRMFTRFWACYVRRKGYREGAWGVLIALMAALYPILSYLKARLEPGRTPGGGA
ncbi:MAG: glycosyltransferase family 2 protein [Alphaproteobacteria bacterium]|nr:glycosyltransferase family 2 protein [Alphaproteobacteria bacterium]